MIKVDYLLNDVRIIKQLFEKIFGFMFYFVYQNFYCIKDLNVKVLGKIRENYFIILEVRGFFNYEKESD